MKTAGSQGDINSAALAEMTTSVIDTSLLQRQVPPAELQD